MKKEKYPTLKQLKDKRKEMLKGFNLPTRILGIPAPYISYLMIRFTKISANQLTLAWVVLSALSMLLIVSGNYSLALTGIIITHFFLIFDQVDGDIARARNMRTIGGPYIDNLALILHRSLLLIVTGIGLYNAGQSILFMHAGISAAFIFLFANVIELKIKDALSQKNIPYSLNDNKSKQPKKLSFLGYLRTGEPLNIIYLLLIFSFLPVIQLVLGCVLVGYFLLASALFIKKFNFIYKKFCNIKNQ